MPHPDHSILIPLPEAARRVSLSLRTFRKLVDAGEIPVVRLSARRVAVAETDLADFVTARRRSPTDVDLNASEGDDTGDHVLAPAS